MKIIIGNKNYSSWSLRGWLALAQTGEAFEEVVIPLDEPGTHDAILVHSQAGRVPVLVDGDVTVWDSLAIAEYLAERFPLAGLWPRDSAARAHARAISAEMHSGFSALRSYYPMNIHRKPAARAHDAAAAADVERVCTIWRETRLRFGHGGSFLFGDFCIADAVYAPVVSRFMTYCVTLGDIEQSYTDAVMAHPAMRVWCEAARAETWIVSGEEVD